MNSIALEAIYQALQQVPYGKVVTYGQLASLAGLGRAARVVGTTLKKLPKDSKLPWYRVINAQGKISFPEDHPSYKRQRLRLLEEGIYFGKNGKIDLNTFLWQP